MAVEFDRLNITSGYNTNKINTNFERVDTALQDSLSRSGNGPNQMNANLDLNGNSLLNARLQSPNGSEWTISVSNEGVLSVVAV